MQLRTLKSTLALFPLFFFAACSKIDSVPTSPVVVPLLSANSLGATFTLADSLGVPHTQFRLGEKIQFAYTLTNNSGQALPWVMGMSYPYADFTVRGGKEVVRDSFYGMAFAAVIVRGEMRPGDSYHAAWSLPSRSQTIPLPAGTYTAVATPMFSFDSFGRPAEQTVEFAVIQ